MRYPWSCRFSFSVFSGFLLALGGVTLSSMRFDFKEKTTCSQYSPSAQCLRSLTSHVHSTVFPHPVTAGVGLHPRHLLSRSQCDLLLLQGVLSSQAGFCIFHLDSVFFSCFHSVVDHVWVFLLLLLLFVPVAPPVLHARSHCWTSVRYGTAAVTACTSASGFFFCPD